MALAALDALAPRLVDEDFEPRQRQAEPFLDLGDAGEVERAGAAPRRSWRNTFHAPQHGGGVLEAQRMGARRQHEEGDEQRDEAAEQNLEHAELRRIRSASRG
ncbi:hypothetical protein [Methylocella sp.]|uniref:hypothetical protein n=1 Tax=Methylocella sp. TaxID=1978226 RepID=UPI00378440E5